MKICHVIYIPRLSGAEILVRDLAISHTKLGHQVSVLALDPPEDSFSTQISYLKDNGVEIFLPLRKIGKIARIKFLIEQINRCNPDVIVAHSIIPSAYTRLSLKWTNIQNIPVVSVLHDGSQNDYSSLYFRILERYFIPSPSCVVALTDIAKSNYQHMVGSQVRVEIIPNGIDLSILNNAQSRRREVRDRIFSAQDNECIFLQVGRFQETKQQDLSIQAFIQACQNSNFSGKLFLAGLVEDIKFEKYLKALIENARLSDRITILGPRSDVPELLASADVYLMPSKQEAHSIAFLEALASGISIIASNISSFKFGLEFTGVKLLETTSIDLWKDEILNTSPISTGKRWARNLHCFGVDEMASKYMSVLTTITK